MLKYKLTDADGYTRRRKVGETYWLDGEEKQALGEGVALCTSGVIHFYDSPEIAAFTNPIHAEFTNPRLFELWIDEQVAHDGLKGGCKVAKLGKELPFPKISTKQAVEIAIRTALELTEDWAGKAKFEQWASNWLSGKDRTAYAAYAAAHAAADAAYAAAHAADAATHAAYAAAHAARAAAHAARAAANAAADAAADAAANAARAAANAATDAAYAAYAAAYAAADAAYAAYAAAYEFSKKLTALIKRVLNAKK
jgi:hypothetical protein